MSWNAEDAIWFDLEKMEISGSDQWKEKLLQQQLDLSWLKPEMVP
ncbi:MAG: hypothetical protein U9P37_08530 [Pseudomonadota bacterium]|nr:hypothetical protein [Pseudomonadota bacterium]